MLNYVGYLGSNLVFTMLLIWMLNDVKSSDSFTLLVSLASVGGGVAQSVINSVILKTQKDTDSAGDYLLGTSTLIKFLAFSALCSLMIATSIGISLDAATRFFFKLDSMKAAYSVSFLLLSLCLGLSSFMQSYLQRNSMINSFYNHFTFATLFVCVPAIILFLTGFKVSLEFCLFCMFGRALLNFNLSLLCILRLRRSSQAVMDRINLRFRTLVPLIFSGYVGKINMPFDRAILIIVGEGFATVYHFVTIIFGAFGRYLDINIIYRLYLKKRESFEKLRVLGFKYIGAVLVVWVMLFVVAVTIYHSVFSHLAIPKSVDLQSLMVIVVAMLGAYVALPMFLSTVTNSLFVLYYYENDLSYWIVKISIISSVSAFSLKLLVVELQSLWLIPIVLNCQFIIMMLLMSFKYRYLA